VQDRNENIPASYLVLIKDNKILMLRRFNTGFEDGNYSVVAGHVEKGESFSQCIIREAKEEAGIILDQNDIKVVHVMHRDSKTSVNNERVDVFFTASKWEGVIENKERDKCDDLAWFDIDNMPENTVEYVRDVISCIRNNVFYSESGWDK